MQLEINEIIKRYIRMRGYRIKEVADKLGMNYKTFAGVLNRNRVSADLLFRLANLLDMDLCWMAQLYGNKQTVSFSEPYQMTRMSAKMREEEQKRVFASLDRYIQENPVSIADVKRELISQYTQLFFLLDVLLPENYVIKIQVERKNKEKYFCVPVTEPERTSFLSRGRAATPQSYEGHEMLKRIILERKARLNP